MSDPDFSCRHIHTRTGPSEVVQEVLADLKKWFEREGLNTYETSLLLQLSVLSPQIEAMSVFLPLNEPLANTRPAQQNTRPP